MGEITEVHVKSNTCEHKFIIYLNVPTANTGTPEWNDLLESIGEYVAERGNTLDDYTVTPISKRE